MLKVITNSKTHDPEKTKYVNTASSGIPQKYRPFILSLVYALLIGGVALLLNGVLEVTFNQTIAFKQPFYFTLFFISIFSFLLPYTMADKALAVEKTNLDGFQVEKVLTVTDQKTNNVSIIIAKILTLLFSSSFFLYSYTTNQHVEKYERITIHNVPIKGVDSVQIAVRMSRNTRDSATPGRFKPAQEASISKKKTYIYEEYTYGFPYQYLKPDKNRDMQEGKKYLDGKRAKILVKWYGSGVKPSEVEGKIEKVFATDAMNDLLLEAFGVAEALEQSTKK